MSYRALCCQRWQSRYKIKVTKNQQTPDHLSHRQPGHAGDDVTRLHRLRCRRRFAEQHISASVSFSTFASPEQLGV
ncbi:unnamed protein product [Tetraodon nigroviridis]|uniref:(spotted green pufferfish) hypothetical protein n=1 Tax=Tetraodon nigroviridis TaxID=99883 RepID=Q4SRS4_TETNG|nr:unnamed protein product [Tetraodon nigroviridis]